MFAKAKNNTAYARLSFNKKLQLFKLVCAFNVTQRNAVTGKLLFPQEKQCNYVSGHFSFDELAKQLTVAEQHLRTNKIVLD
jgi:hypothetical protein